MLRGPPQHVLPAQRSSACPLAVPRPGPARKAAIPDNYFDEIDAMAKSRAGLGLLGSWPANKPATESSGSLSCNQPDPKTIHPPAAEPSPTVIVDPRSEPTSPLLRPLPALPSDADTIAPPQQTGARACAESSARAQTEYSVARLRQARQQQQHPSPETERVALEADKVLQRPEDQWEATIAREQRVQTNYERLGKQKLADYEASQAREEAERARQQALQNYETSRANERSAAEAADMAAEEAAHLAAFREARQRAQQQTAEWSAAEAAQLAIAPRVQQPSRHPPKELNRQAWEKAEARSRTIAKARSREAAKRKTRQESERMARNHAEQQRFSEANWRAREQAEQLAWAQADRWEMEVADKAARDECDRLAAEEARYREMHDLAKQRADQSTEMWKRAEREQCEREEQRGELIAAAKERSDAGVEYLRAREAASVCAIEGAHQLHARREQSRRDDLQSLSRATAEAEFMCARETAMDVVNRCARLRGPPLVPDNILVPPIPYHHFLV